MKFVCRNCNYRFESDTDKTEQKCPYCGKNEVKKDPDADSLLNEAD